MTNRKAVCLLACGFFSLMFLFTIWSVYFYQMILPQGDERLPLIWFICGMFLFIEYIFAIRFFIEAMDNNKTIHSLFDSINKDAFPFTCIDGKEHNFVETGMVYYVYTDDNTTSKGSNNSPKFQEFRCAYCNMSTNREI